MSTLGVTIGISPSGTTHSTSVESHMRQVWRLVNQEVMMFRLDPSTDSGFYQQHGSIQRQATRAAMIKSRGVHIGNRNQFALAARDFRDGLCSIHVWPMLGWL